MKREASRITLVILWACVNAASAIATCLGGSELGYGRRAASPALHLESGR